MFRHVLRSMRRPSGLPTLVTRISTHGIVRPSRPVGVELAWPHSSRVICRALSSSADQPELLTYQQVKKLCTTNQEQFAKMNGKPAYFTMLKRLKLTWQDFCKHNPYPNAADLKTFFNAAKAMGMDTVMVETVMAMREVFPKELKAKHYLESRVSFLRLGKFNEMIQIFEDEKRAHPHPQPIFYIWALTAYIELNNMQKLKELLTEMKHEGYMVPNETVSRLLFKLAKMHDKSTILEILPDLDPNVGIWTVAALNRTMTSLGMVGLPQEAFKFYANSTMELDPSTFKTVLEIAVRNRCMQEATDILQNRKLFDLKLEVAEYNIIIEALIMLDRPGEIPLILEEMAETNTKPNAKTESLVKTLTIPHRFQRPVKNADDQILREKLKQGQAAAAAAVADGILVHTPTPKHIQPILEAYVKTNQHDKVDAILESMQSKEWPSPLEGLVYLMKHYCHREVVDGKGRTNDPTRAMEVYKAIKHQGVSIWQPKPFFTVMLQLGEWEPALDLFHKMLKLEELKKDAYTPSKQLRIEAFNDVMRVCAKMQQYKPMEDLVDHMISLGHEISPSVFKSLWFDPVKYAFYGISSDDKHQHSEMLQRFAATVASILSKIYTKQPNFVPSYTTVDALTNLLYYGNERKALLELYRRAKNDPSKFALPELTYQKILQVMASQGTRTNLAEVRELYEEAMQKVPNMTSRSLIEASLVRAVTQAGRYKEMHELLTKHPSGASFRGALEVLLASHRFNDARVVLQDMLNAGFVPNAPLLIKAFSRFTRSAQNNPNTELPIDDFVKAFEDQVVVDGKVVTKKGNNEPNRKSFTVRDVQKVYSVALGAYRASQNEQAANEIAERMKSLSIRRVDVDIRQHLH